MTGLRISLKYSVTDGHVFSWQLHLCVCWFHLSWRCTLIRIWANIAQGKSGTGRGSTMLHGWVSHARWHEAFSGSCLRRQQTCPPCLPQGDSVCICSNKPTCCSLEAALSMLQPGHPPNLKWGWGSHIRPLCVSKSWLFHQFLQHVSALFNCDTQWLNH